MQPPFQLLAGDGPRWNFGDPACADVLVLDEEVTDAVWGIQCPICGFVYDGIAIRIEGGKVQSAAPQKPGMIEMLRRGAVEPVKAFEVRADHTRVVRDDWYLGHTDRPRQLNSDVGFLLLLLIRKMRRKKTSDLDLAIRMAKLWPNRQHEASAIFGLLCRLGVHRWRALDTTSLVPQRRIQHCLWCSKVRIDGIVYDV